MTEVKQYRIKMQEDSEWSLWRPLPSDNRIYTQSTRWVEFRIAREYLKGTKLDPHDHYIDVFEVLHPTVYIEKLGGRREEFIACRTIYKDGDESFCFMSVSKLDKCTVKGE